MFYEALIFGRVLPGALPPVASGTHGSAATYRRYVALRRNAYRTESHDKAASSKCGSRHSRETLAIHLAGVLFCFDKARRLRFRR